MVCKNCKTYRNKIKRLKTNMDGLVEDLIKRKEWLEYIQANQHLGSMEVLLKALFTYFEGNLDNFDFISAKETIKKKNLEMDLSTHLTVSIFTLEQLLERYSDYEVERKYTLSNMIESGMLELK